MPESFYSNTLSIAKSKCNVLQKLKRVLPKDVHSFTTSIITNCFKIKTYNRKNIILFNK